LLLRFSSRPVFLLLLYSATMRGGAILGRQARIAGRSLLAQPVKRSDLPLSGCAVTQVHGRCNSSFIRQVMDQVKRDMENDPKLKKDWEAVDKSSAKLGERAAQGGERLQNVGDRLKDVAGSTSSTLNDLRTRFANASSEAKERVSGLSEQNESIKKAAEAARNLHESGSERAGSVLGKAKGVFGSVVDKTASAVSFMDDGKAEKLKEWKAQRDTVSATQASMKAKEDKAAAEAKEADLPPPVVEDGPSALVVSKDNTSSWDRFGARISDMPFLHSVFENPLFDQLFGESEIAASIREMKEIDRFFRLEDFTEDMEYVVAPHIVRSFLEGEADELQKHLGEAAFTAVNASIKARNSQKMSLDPSILAGPQEVELKGAKLMETGAPCFIWTFNTQQVNCLRDKHGEIIEGGVDDIRTVYYAMAVTRHPELEQLDLEYPWQISELAIVGNQPCW